MPLLRILISLLSNCVCWGAKSRALESFAKFKKTSSIVCCQRLTYWNPLVTRLTEVAKHFVIFSHFVNFQLNFLFPNLFFFLRSFALSQDPLSLVASSLGPESRFLPDMQSVTTSHRLFFHRPLSASARAACLLNLHGNDFGMFGNFKFFLFGNTEKFQIANKQKRFRLAFPDSNSRSHVSCCLQAPAIPFGLNGW